MGRKRKICGIVLSAALVAASTGALYACGDKPQLNENFEGRTVCYELPTDGSTPEDHTGIENIGYMAYRLQNQTNYYSYMEGTVDTIINQSVMTYKQYNDGVLIATDISISSLVKTAKQLCYVGDSVLWREAAKSASEWDGLNTEWKTDEPAHVTTADFKNSYGLPATEFSVYVLNEDTVLEADDVVNNGDGTYSQTFRLSTDGEKAVYYYRQQMRETGGLDEWPEYESIEVTYTFDSDWQILQSYILESYNVKMVMSVGCTAEYTTNYEYNTDKAVTDDYQNFYSKYADKPASSPAVSGGLTPVTCLTQAFGGVLAGATTFDITLDLNGTEIDGAIYLDLSDMSDPEVRAQFGNLNVWYTDGAAYLSYGNLKAQLTVSELMGLLQTAMASDSNEGTLDLDTNALLSQLGAGTFTVTESKANLSAALDLLGLHLPVVFSFDMQDGVPSFDYLGAVISVSDFNIGVTATMGDTEIPALSVGEKAGYIEVSSYIGKLYDLFTQDVLSVALSYQSEAISVEGGVAIDMQNGAVQGDLDLSLYGTEKTVKFAYANSYVYLELDGFKGKLSASDAIAYVKNYLGDMGSMTDSLDLGGILDAVFSDRVANLFAMSEGSDALRVVVNGTELLKEFGIDFELGSVSLAVSEGRLDLSAYGANLSVTAGEPFEVIAENYPELPPYADVTDFIKEILSIVEEKQISFDGLLDISVGSQTKKTVASLYIPKGIISWKNGFNAYIELSLLAGGTQHDFLFSAGEEGYTVAYGPVGAAVTKEDLPTLESAVVALYNRIANIVNEMMEKEGETLPQIQSLEEILDLLEQSELFAGAMQSMDFDGEKLAAMLDKVQILAPEQANGILKLAFGGLTAELLNVTQSTRPEFQVGYANKGVALSLDMKASAFKGELPAVPENISLMGAEEIAELFDYIGSAAEMLTAENLSLSLNGNVTSTEETYADTDGVKYQLNANVDYYAGSSFPVHIDLDNYNFWINPDLFAHITVDVLATHETDAEFYLDFLIMNGHEDDETLDLYLSVSRYSKKGERKHFAPLKIYLPMSEFATVGASALSVLGIDIDFLNETLLASWLEATTVDQLRALGKSLTSSLDIKGLLGGLISQSTDDEKDQLSFQEGAFAGVIKAVNVNRADEINPANLAIVLDSGMIYGDDTVEDITVGITKDTYTQTNTDEEGNESSVQKGYISGLTLSGVSLSEGKERLGFTCAISPTCSKIAAPELTGYYNGTGIGELLKIIANSITTDTEVISGEQVQHDYKINRNFYIDGSAKLSAFGILNATVDIVAISVTLDEDEKVGINLRLEYQGVQAVNQVAINGDSALDITIKDGMVYMKRTQYTYWETVVLWTSEVTYDTPVVVYRAMPLENLFGDFLGQLKYMLNMGKVVTDLMDKDPDPVAPLGYEPDYGEQAKNVLTSYTYLKDIKDKEGNITAKEGWNLVLNGDGLTNGVMGDLNITLKTDLEGTVLRGIDFNCPKLGIKGIDLTANLIYRNPCGVMEQGKDGNAYQDITQPVDLGDMLKETIEATDWETKTYLEIRSAQTTYIADGNVLGEVQSLYDTATNARLGGGEIPSVPAKQGHTGEWGSPVGSMEEGYTVAAVYTPNLYPVTVQDGESVYHTQLRYGAKITFTANGNEVASYTVTDGVNEFTVPAVPSVEGYNSAWTAGSVSENGMEIQADYTREIYTVTLTSQDPIAGFIEEGGVYVKRVSVEFGGTVVVRFRGNDYATYPVTDGENVFALPELPLKNGHSALWELTECNVHNVCLSADYQKDTVIYHSEIALDNNGTQTIEDSFNSDTYTLRSGMTANGYTFLGWFVETESGWVKADNALSLTGAGARVELEALWAKDLSIAVSCVRSGSLTKYQYTITAKTEGGELIGAAASAVQISTYFHVYVSLTTVENNVMYEGQSEEFDGLVKEYTGTTGKNAGATCTHAVVNVTYTYQGEELYSQHQFKSISSPTKNG